MARPVRSKSLQCPAFPFPPARAAAAPCGRSDFRRGLPGSVPGWGVHRARRSSTAAASSAKRARLRPLAAPAPSRPHSTAGNGPGESAPGGNNLLMQPVAVAANHHQPGMGNDGRRVQGMVGHAAGRHPVQPLLPPSGDQTSARSSRRAICTSR
jgi:hypothetical protein